LIQEIEANQKQANKSKKSARPTETTPAQGGTNDNSEVLYFPVDDDDI
tara:strand:+ start:139 stop:282 length:144 start_codon:yes stop_codon:yes gene_type:complete